MHGHKVLCLALVCIDIAEGEASRAGSLFPPAHTNTVCMFAIWTRKWDRVCWLASGSEIRFSLTAPSDWITQQTIRFAWSEDNQASGGVKGCYLSDEVRSKATWCNTISHTVALFDRPLPFAAGNKSQFHHLPGGRSIQMDRKRREVKEGSAASVGTEKKNSTKQSPNQKCLVQFASDFNDLKNRHTT